MLSDIKKLIPFVCENFLSFPLWEEGDFRPFLRVWLNFDNLPENIIDKQKIDLLKLDCKTFAKKDFFDVYCYVKKIEQPENEFYDIKSPAKSWFNVEFEISNSREFIDDDNLYIGELVFIANYILNHFQHLSNKA